MKWNINEGFDQNYNNIQKQIEDQSVSLKCIHATQIHSILEPLSSEVKDSSQSQSLLNEG